METIPISKFKARCLSLMDRVRRTGQPVRVTRYGRPVADVVPVSATVQPSRTLGGLSARTAVTGDIVAPAVDAGVWAVLHDQDNDAQPSTDRTQGRRRGVRRR